MLTLASFVRRRRPVTSGVLFLVHHRVELLRLVRVDRQQLVDHLSDGRVFPDPRIHVHRVGVCIYIMLRMTTRLGTYYRYT